MKRLCIAWAAAIVAVLGPASAFAGNITLTASSAEVAPGADFSVSIDVAGNPGLGAFHIELTYDPAVLAAQSVEPGAMLSDAMMDKNLGTPGRVVLGAMTSGGFKGDGPLAIVKFKAIGGLGKGCPVGLEKCQAWTEGEGALPLSPTMVAGQVKLTGGGSTGGGAGGAPGGIPWMLVGGGGAGLVLLIVLVAALGKKGQPGTFCSTCGTPMASAGGFCPKCGKPRAALAACVKCGTPFQGEAQFCQKCGAARS